MEKRPSSPPCAGDQPKATHHLGEEEAWRCSHPAKHVSWLHHPQAGAWGDQLPASASLPATALQPDHHQHADTSHAPEVETRRRTDAALAPEPVPARRPRNGEADMGT